MNYILQIFSEKDSDVVQVDQYQPRRNKVWSGTMTKEELKPQVEETIERMKIAINQMQEYLDGKRDTFIIGSLKMNSTILSIVANGRRYI